MNEVEHEQVVKKAFSHLAGKKVGLLTGEMSLGIRHDGGPGIVT